MTLYADKEIYGPGCAVRVRLVRRGCEVRRTWVMRYRAGRPGKAPWKRCKWTWLPRCVLQRPDRARTSARNRAWLHQHDRIIHLIRPPHLRRPKRG